MIATIGSLVQETSTRMRWWFASALYVAACICTSAVLGACLGGLGRIGRNMLCSLISVHGACGPGDVNIATVPAALVGLIALAYAASDLGLVRMPRPHVMYAVPVTWWRRWQPYGASLAYGAALGLGVTTRILFGGFYVLGAWCVVRGDIAYAALLMGTYGATRALTLVPASWYTYRPSSTAEACGTETWSERLVALPGHLASAREFISVIIALFGSLILMSAMR